MADVFLQKCAAGTQEEIDSILQENPSLLFTRDDLNRNGLSVAIINANWKVALHLLINHRISPHVIDSAGNTIYHHLVDGVLKSEPTEADLSEIRSDLMGKWQRDYQDQLSRLQSKQSSNIGTRPPTKIILKHPKMLDSEFFGTPKTFLAKFILGRYHVVIGRKNNEEKTAAVYALDLGEADLASLYEDSSDFHPSRRRLIQGLNDALIRLVGSYL